MKSQIVGRVGSVSSPAQRFALAAGVLYVVTAVAGFLLIGLGNFPLLPKATLVIFGINPLHNLLHLVVGMLWIYAATSLTMARRTNVILGVAFGALTVLGLMNLLGFLGVSGIADPDNFLHLISAALSLYFGTAGATRSDDLSRPTGPGAEGSTTQAWWS